MPYKNPEERKAYRRKWYAKNREKEIDHIRRRKKEIRKWFLEFKSNLKCTKCGEKHPATLDFHHVKKNKDRGVALMAYYGYSIERIKKEMDKCIVLCSNCHRKEHYKEKL